MKKQKFDLKYLFLLISITLILSSSGWAFANRGKISDHFQLRKQDKWPIRETSY